MDRSVFLGGGGDPLSLPLPEETLPGILTYLSLLLNVIQLSLWEIAVYFLSNIILSIYG